MTPIGPWQIACEGDIGDAVILAGIIAQIPHGPHTMVLQKSKMTKMRDDASLARFHAAVKDLFQAQSYISTCRIAAAGDDITWDSSRFRGTGLHSRSASLFDAQLSHLLHVHSPVGTGFSAAKPWLTVPPSPASKNRVVIARSPRYRNGYFNWKAVVKHYGDRLLFIGLPSEYQEFIGTHGLVEYYPTPTMFEVAKVIAGSSLFICNQTSSMAVCEGLKHPSIQETSLDPADCIYHRDNAQYCYDGAMRLPDVDDSGVLHVPSTIPVTEANPNFSMVPPGGWQYPDFGTSNHFGSLRSMVARNLGVSASEAEQLIYQHNAARLPTFFVSQEREAALRFVRPALLNAGYTL